MVSAALSELAGIKKVDIDLENDQFTVVYNDKVTSLDEMKASIAELGYRPRIVSSTLVRSDSQPLPFGPIPEPIATALNNSRITNMPVFVDFYAEWCGACKVMEKTTLVDPTVLKTLEQFQVLKVDADEFPVATQHFRVFGMPTYIVLDTTGKEKYRHVGPIDVENLVENLLSMTTPQ